jgi:small subunit ribosomal protein S16
MLTIRLQRVGRKHEPTFRVVVADHKTSAKKYRRFHEIVGSYDARDKNVTNLNAERIKYWLSVGAQPSGTVHNLLITKGVTTGKKINVLPQKTAPAKKEEVTA